MEMDRCPHCKNDKITECETYSMYQHKESLVCIVFEAQETTGYGIYQVYTSTDYIHDKPIVVSNFLGFILKNKNDFGAYSQDFKRKKMLSFYQAKFVVVDLCSYRWDDSHGLIPTNEFIAALAVMRNTHKLYAHSIFAADYNETTVWKGKKLEYRDSNYAYTSSKLIKKSAVGSLNRYRWTCGKCGKSFFEDSKYGTKSELKCPSCNAKNYANIESLIPREKTYLVHISENTLQFLLICGSHYYKAQKELINEMKKALIEINKEGKVKFFIEKNNTFTRVSISDFYAEEFIKRSKHYSSDTDVLDFDLDKITFEGLKRTGWIEYRAKTQNVLNFNDFVEYFALFSDYPALEMLSKMGLSSLVSVLYQNYGGDLGFIPKEMRSPSSKKFIKLLASSEIRYFNTISDLVDCFRRDEDMCWEDFAKISSKYRKVQDLLRLKIPGLNLHQIVKYLDYVDEFQCCGYDESVQLFADYLRNLKRLECDLTDRRLIYTNSLKREHDKAARKVSQIRDEKTCEQFVEVVNEPEYTQFAFTGEDYSVICPSSPQDLFEEGRKLNHCVGSYLQDIAYKRTKIYFVRDNADKNKSLATMEIRDNNAVWQLRGFSNSTPCNKVTNFVKRYAKEHNLIYDV